MKKILTGLLTLIVIGSFVGLGVSFCIEAVLVDTIDILVKEEITNSIVDLVGDNFEVDKEEVKKEVTKVLDDNPVIKKTIGNYFDKLTSVIENEEAINVNIEDDIVNLILESEPVLNNYGIVIDQEEIIDTISNEKINDFLNDSVLELRDEMSNDDYVILDAFNYLRGVSFKLILIVVIGVSLIFIALLKKSYYRFLSNLGVASIISGIIVGFVVTYLIDLVFLDYVIVSTQSFKTFGYVVICLGIISIVARIVIGKLAVNHSEDVC